ncbi:MAG: hypothetical protein ACC619_00090 [Paracoccaceae bacterium]
MKNLPPVRQGYMRLYRAFEPALTAGRYTVKLEQDLYHPELPDDANIAPVERHLEVTGPRLRLPVTEIHSVFPPAKRVGPFENRLPHIALKRRTLPWERVTGTTTPEKKPRDPWLALVVLAEGEANFKRNVSVADYAGTLSQALQDELDLDETETMDMLEVTRDIVNAVFPREDELAMLAHVRQVNLSDTEAAGGDNDGFMSVLLSNRLPLPGHSYGAYLISLEGRLEELPDPRPPVPDIEFERVYGDIALEIIYQAERSFDDDITQFNGSPSFSAGVMADTARSDFAVVRAASDSVAAKAAGNRRNEFMATAPANKTRADISTGTRASAWHPVRKDGGVQQALFVPAVSGPASNSQLHAVDFGAFLKGVELVRFPVLASWTFACSERPGDFETLMKEVDIGLYGKPKNASTDQTLPLSPEPLPDFTDTGHTIVGHTTRRGESVTSWYRGPVVPRQVVRRTDDAPYHTSDQARRIADDDREDISEASAFEVGRLLALSDVRFVQSLSEWRRNGFAIKRRKAGTRLFAGLNARIDLVDAIRVGVIDRLLKRNLLGELIEIDALRLEQAVLVNDAIDRFSDKDIDVIASGFAIPIKQVAETLSSPLAQPGLTSDAVISVLGSDFDKIVGNSDQELAHLGRALDTTVFEIARNIGVGLDEPVMVRAAFDARSDLLATQPGLAVDRPDLSVPKSIRAARAKLLDRNLTQAFDQRLELLAAKIANKNRRP